MAEIELKFTVTGARRADIEHSQLALAARHEILLAHYFDTQDGRLAAAGLTLRTRRCGGHWEQTLKAPARAGIERLEENADRPGAWSDAGPKPDPTLHAGSAAARRLDAALSVAPTDVPVRWQRICTLAIDRRIVLHAGESGDVEIAFDEGRIEAGGREARVCEIEYELKAGNAAALLHAARQGALAHGLALTSISKAQRGARLLRGAAHGPAVHATPPPLVAPLNGAQLVRVLVSNCVEQILANASEIAEGASGEDCVHQLRVGIRRLRTVLRELGDFAPGIGEWEAPLAAAFRALGRIRDRQSAAQAFAAELQAAGAPPIDGQAGAAADLPDPASVVCEAMFQDTLVQAAVFCVTCITQADAAPPPASQRPLVEPLAEVLEALHRRLRRDAKRFERLDIARQHAVRKRLKRLRYLTELLAPLYEAKAVERYLKRLEPAQEALGRHTDRATAASLFRIDAESGRASAWFAVGWLEAIAPVTAKAAGIALRRLRDRNSFW